MKIFDATAGLASLAIDDGEDVVEPAPQLVDKSQLVWHYTRYETLPLILRSHTFRLTSATNLNDSAELLLGERRMKKALKKLRPSGYDFDELSEFEFERLEEFERNARGVSFDGSAFVFSLSRRGDDNSQWERYAGWDGYALGLPEGALMPVVGSPSELPSSGYVEEFPFRWVRLSYKRSDQERVAEEGWYRAHGELTEADHAPREWDFGRFFYDRALSEYVEAVGSMKSRGYECEREVRYFVKEPDNADVIGVKGPTYEGDTSASFIHVTGNREARWASAGHDPDYYQSTPTLLPLVAVRLGPHQTPDKREKLQRLLDETGYGDVVIKRSKSTHRRAAAPPAG